MQAVTTIGLDIARSVFQVHGIDAEGNAIIRRKLTAGTLAVLLKAETEKWSKNAPDQVVAQWPLLPRHFISERAA
jgi:hypothetical protein